MTRLQNFQQRLANVEAVVKPVCRAAGLFVIVDLALQRTAIPEMVARLTAGLVHVPTLNGGVTELAMISALLLYAGQ